MPPGLLRPDRYGQGSAEFRIFIWSSLDIVDAPGWLESKDSQFPNTDAKRHAGRFFLLAQWPTFFLFFFFQIFVFFFFLVVFCFLFFVFSIAGESSLNVTSRPNHPAVIPCTAGKACLIILDLLVFLKSRMPMSQNALLFLSRIPVPYRLYALTLLFDMKDDERQHDQRNPLYKHTLVDKHIPSHAKAQILLSVASSPLEHFARLLQIGR